MLFEFILFVKMLSHLPRNNFIIVRIMLSPVPVDILVDIPLLSVPDPVLQFH